MSNTLRAAALGAWSLSLTLSGCGGSSSGGGGGGPAVSNPGTPGADGGVVAAPVVGSTVRVYTIDPASRALTTLTTATTGADGSYSVDFTGPGPFLLVANGGDFEDEATGSTITLASINVNTLDGNLGRSLCTIVGSGVTGRFNLWLTPLSTFATRRVIELSSADPNLLSETEISRISRELGQELGLGTNVDVRAVEAFDFSDPADATQIAGNAGGPQARAGLLLAALSQEANDLGLTDPLALVEALGEDFRDGGFNGRRGTTQLSVGGQPLSPVAATVGLAEAAANFLDGPRNQSGVGSASYTSFFTALELVEVIAAGVNRPPTLSPIADVTLAAGATAHQLVLSGISEGAGEVQQLTVSASAQPAALLTNLQITGTGGSRTLSFEVTANGLATVTVQLQDDGGTANGGNDTFVRTFSVTIGSGGSQGGSIPGLVIPAAGTVPNEWFVNNDPSSGMLHSHSSAEQSFADQVLAEVNAYRAQNGLAALTYDPLLEVAAKVHAEDMSRRNYFSHSTQDFTVGGATVTGFSAFTRMDRVGATNGNRENIAFGYSSPTAVMDGWKNSSGHNANILASNITKLGVGYSANGRYWVQNFGR